MDLGLSRSVRSLIVIACVALGILFGTMLDPVAVAAASACENDACGVANGNCFPSDVPYNCRVTGLGCKSTAC